ncbi:putative ribonuclease H-like domain-containing protein [Tanacetum coccineum]
MAYSSTSSSSSTNSEVSNDSNCCSSCLECVKNLKEQNEQLVKDLRTARVSDVSYKTGLESVEARLLIRKLKLVTKEKDEVQLTVQKFENSSKSLSELLDRKIMDKCKTGLGYNAVPPPYTGNFMPPKHDLVYPSLDDFVEVNESASESVVEKPTVETNEPKTARKEDGAPIIEDWVSESEEEDMPKIKTIEMYNKPSFAKINFVKSTKQVKSPKNTSVDKNRQNTPSPRGETRSNWKPSDGNPQQDLKDKGVIDSGCSRHMTGNRSYLTDYEEIDGGFVAFGGNSKGGKITGKGKIRTGKLDFKDVYFVKELKFNLFSVSQMCDKKNSIFFTDIACVVLSPDFKLPDESHVLLKVPKKDNMYNVDLKNIIPQGGPIFVLFAKITPGYSTNSKAFGVFNSRTRIVEENLHVQFSENTPNIAGSGPNCTKAYDNTGKARMETIPSKDYILLPLSIQDLPFSSSSKDSPDAGFKPSGEREKGENSEVPSTEEPRVHQEKDASVSSTNTINYISLPITTAGIEDNAVDENIIYGCADDPNIPHLEDIVYSDDDEVISAKADITNLDIVIPVSLIPTTRIRKDHPVKQIIGDIHSAPQTRRMTKSVTEHAMFKEPKKVIQALKDPSWIEAMQDELLQFKLQKVWTLVDLPNEKRDIGTKWVYRNTKDERVARIKAIRLFLAYSSYKDFMMYQMDVKSAFLYGKIEEEVYVYQPPGFEDPDFLNRVYKVEKALYGLHQGPRAWYETLSTYLLDNGFQRGKIDKTLFIKRDKGDILLVQVSMGELTFFLGLQVKQKEDGIFLSQNKYVTEILKKFGFSDVKTASTPMETHKPLLKDADGEDVDEHLYRSMIRSLMYLTSSRPDIMFAVCACARFQVNPKISHLHAMKRIFRYLKGQPKLGLWYPKDSPFDLVAFTDSDYAGASLDKKSTTRGCQFLRCRLISWQCKKQTVVANSITKAEYIAASNCCRQVLWIQNQLLDYGYNFMHTKIYINNESTICIVKNPVFYSKTKHIEIRHHFIRDSNEKKLIQVIKIHTDQNVTDFLTKVFDVSRFQYLIESLNFADSHNIVAYLEKSIENVDFVEIVDFVNVNPIRYALTVSPTIYVSCIEQFWSTAKNKTVNKETQIHAKVEGKTIVILESSVRRDL